MGSGKSYGNAIGEPEITLFQPSFLIREAKCQAISPGPNISPFHSALRVIRSNLTGDIQFENGLQNAMEGATMDSRFIRTGIVVLVLLVSSSSLCQTATDFWKVNLQFEGIRTDMSLLMGTTEGAEHIQQQQLILSGADNYRGRTRAMMAYLQILTYVSEPSKIRSARLDIASMIEEDIQLDRRLATAYKKMGESPYGRKTQGLASRLGKVIAEMAELEDGLLNRS